jgi:hypothetical protein
MTVIPFPRTPEAMPVADRASPALMDARQVAARPDLYGRATILAACDVLAAWGDWLDVQRADHLRAALALEPADAPTIRLPWWGWCLAGAAAVVLGAIAAETLVQMADAATARQIAQGAREW